MFEGRSTLVVLEGFHRLSKLPFHLIIFINITTHKKMLAYSHPSKPERNYPLRLREVIGAEQA